MSVEKFLNSDRVYELWAKIKEALAGKQDVITAGDGLSKEDGVLGVDTPVRGIVTRGEFDALPAEQRNKGFYVIPEAGDTSGAYDQVYSTEETRIGTWIDGKPLYRKVYSLKTGTLSRGKNAVVSYDPAFDVKHFWSSIIRSTGDCFNTGVFLSDPSFQVSTFLTNHSVCLYTGDSMAGSISNAPITIVLEYTKTTDQPEVTE